MDKLSALQQDLAPRKGTDQRYLQTPDNGPKLNRFNDIRANADTAVSPDLNANRIKIGDVNRAIASQYPLPHQIESHLRALAENRTPVLVVLSSDAEIADPKTNMPDYFSGSNQYGGIHTTSRFTKTISLGEGITADIFNLTINEAGKKPIAIPVMHVNNWPDHGALGVVSTEAMVKEILDTSGRKIEMYEKAGSTAVGDPNKLLPWVHCRAGVGRTGVAIARMTMTMDPAISVEQTVSDMRATRNGVMVQTEGQLDTLIKLAASKNSPLLKAAL